MNLSPDYRIANDNREHTRRFAISSRISKVERQANAIQDHLGCARTEALRIAEHRVPHYAVAY